MNAPLPKNYRFPFPPFPNGWFRVADTRELKRGRVMPLRYFGRDLVLYRAEDGTPRMFDAHCPHLGAHLGHGGRLVDGRLRCPLHGWQFDKSGECVKVPYCKRFPEASLKPWHLLERNGFILAYYHAEGHAPTWEVPAHPECEADDWTPVHPIKSWTVKTHVQDLLENGIDIAHFTELHSQSFEGTIDDSLEPDGEKIRFRVTPQYHSRRLLGLFNHRAQGSLETTYYGLGCTAARLEVKSVTDLKFMVMSTLTPIEEDTIDFRLVVTIRKKRYGWLNRLAIASIAKESIVAAEQDLPIMEQKTYLTKPLFCRGDGKMGKFRVWAKQFYLRSELDGNFARQDDSVLPEHA